MTFYKGKRKADGTTEVVVTDRNSLEGEPLVSPDGVSFDWGTFGVPAGRRALAYALIRHAVGVNGEAHVAAFELVFVDTLAHTRWELARVKVQRLVRRMAQDVKSA